MLGHKAILELPLPALGFTQVAAVEASSTSAFTGRCGVKSVFCQRFEEKDERGDATVHTLSRIDRHPNIVSLYFDHHTAANVASKYFVVQEFLQVSASSFLRNCAPDVGVRMVRQLTQKIIDAFCWIHFRRARNNIIVFYCSTNCRLISV